MASVVAYTKLMLVQRVRKHTSNSRFINDAYAASDREILLYIDEALAFNLIGQVYAAAKVEGALVVPEAYYTTYALPTLLQDNTTSWWYTTLPQPPISLPLGYSIDRVYFASTANGVSQSVFPIERKRLAYRNDMPFPNGARYWVEGSKLWIVANNGQPLLGLNLYASMVKTRTENINEVMNLPDDAIEGIFNNVVQKLNQRYGEPKDIINDNVGAGMTTQKQ